MMISDHSFTMTPALINQKSRNVLAILMKGHPGCGKSTLARALGTLYNFPVVDKDDAKDAMQELAEGVDADIINKISYNIMVNVVRRQMAHGVSVIVDSPLSRRDIYERLKCIATEHHATVIILECISSNTHVWNERLVRRAQAATFSSHKPSNLQDVKDLMQSYKGENVWQEDDALVHRITIDTTIMESIDDQVYTVMTYFQQKKIYDAS